MTKLYTKQTWQDEVLAGDERYAITDDGTGVIAASAEIALTTGVVQAGSPVDADRMNHIEEGIDAIDDRVNGLYNAGAAMAPFLALPGLRGFWPMSSIGDAGAAIDLSGQGRHMAYNGNPAYARSGLASYLALDGTGDYLSRTDEPGFSILGTEPYIIAGVRGITFGGWFYFSAAPGTQQVMMSKAAGGSAPTYSYFLVRTSGGLSQTYISNGTTGYPATSTATLGQSVWNFVVGRFVPSTSVDNYINLSKTSNSSAIPAAANNAAGPLCIGVSATSIAPMAGSASFCFISAMALPDATINNLYERSRGLFGV